MRRFACICCAAVLVGCADTAEEDPGMAGDTTLQPAPAPVPAGIALSDVAGTWNVRVLPETGDSVLTTYTLRADTDSSWTMVFTGRTDTIPVQVLNVAGDSLVMHVGPYSSALRPNVMVTTHVVARVQGGMLMGRGEARYATAAPDSLLIVRIEGTRMQ